MVLQRLREAGVAARRPLRERRRAALVVGTIAGVGSALAVDAVAPTGFEELLAIVLGVGGSAYYVLHYERLMPEGRESFQRGFLRIFAVIWLFDLVTTDDAPFREVLPKLVAVAAIVLLVAYSVAADVQQRAHPSEPPGNE